MWKWMRAQRASHRAVCDRKRRTSLKPSPAHCREPIGEYEKSYGRIYLDKGTVAALLRAKSRLIGMQQNRLADALVIRPNKLAQWETGRQKPCSDWYLIHDMVWLRLFLKHMEEKRDALIGEIRKRDRVITTLNSGLRAARVNRRDIDELERQRKKRLTQRLRQVTNAYRKQLDAYEAYQTKQTRDKILAMI